MQEALDTTLWFALSYSEWFTPTTLVRLSHGGTTKQGDTNGDPLYLFIRLWGHHIFFGGSVSDGVVTCPIFFTGEDATLYQPCKVILFSHYFGTFTKAYHKMLDSGSVLHTEITNATFVRRTLSMALSMRAAGSKPLGQYSASPQNQRLLTPVISEPYCLGKHSTLATPKHGPSITP